MATRHACPGLRRAINWSSGKIVHPAHFTAAQFRTEGPYCWILSHLLVSNIEEVIRTLLEWRKIHGTIRIAEVEWKCSNIRNQTPSYDINVQIYLSDTRYNTSGLIRVLVSRSHSNCSLGYMPAVVRPTHTRHCICTDVQPTLLYLYRCSIYTSLSVQVFNLHFCICTHVQPTLLYLYTCSTHTSPYGSFNLFHTQVRKPKGIRQPGTINIAISRGPEHRLHCLLNLVGLTACI